MAKKEKIFECKNIVKYFKIGEDRFYEGVAILVKFGRQGTAGIDFAVSYGNFSD